jgi:hypothetical protein
MVPDGGHNELYEEPEVQEAYADLVTRIADAAPDTTESTASRSSER